VKPFSPRIPAELVLALVAFVALAGLGFLPLFAGPGYESSLASGLLLPPMVALAAALFSVRKRPEPFDSLTRGIVLGIAFAALGYVVTLLHGLRSGFCDIASGSLFYLLGPGFGCLLGGAWGAVIGEVVARKRGTKLFVFATLLALALPLASILLSLGRFYSSPIIFAFDPFFGFFSGALYDTVIDDARPRLMSYRVGSGLTLIAATLLAANLERGTGRWPRWRLRPGLLVLGIAAGVASLVVTLSGPRLGHWQTARSIENELGGRLEGERCDVVYDRTLGLDKARLFVRDCDAQVRAVEGWMGVEGGDRITAFLFRDPGQKRRLMGAATTYIAKPWRKEVYVQDAGFPHPVLGHEIAHVVAGSFSKGPFRVGGALWGLRSNPGLVEGIAVAASPDEDDDLTPLEWSRAMLDLGILPRLDRVFAFGFFAESAAKSYTVAGAFVGFLHDRFGAETVRRWYAGEAIDALTGDSLANLEASFHEHLRGLSISEHASAIAKARFDRPSIFGRRCPHEVDKLRDEAGIALASGDLVLAKSTYDELLRLDPHDVRARFSLATCHLRGGDAESAETELQRLADDESKPRLLRDRALENLADLALQSGDLAKAEDLYRTLHARTLDEDRKRTLEVKLHAIENPQGREAIVAYLVGTPARGVDPIEAASALGAWSAIETDDGLPDYLLARNFFGRGLYQEAAKRLDGALGKSLALESIRKEAWRLRMITACALEDREGVERAFRGWEEEAGQEGGARASGVRRLYARCGG